MRRFELFAAVNGFDHEVDGSGQYRPRQRVVESRLRIKVVFYHALYHLLTRVVLT